MKNTARKVAISAATAVAAITISLGGAGVASAIHTGVVIGPVHPQIDTLVGGVATNVGVVLGGLTKGLEGATGVAPHIGPGPGGAPTAAR